MTDATIIDDVWDKLHPYYDALEQMLFARAIELLDREYRARFAALAGSEIYPSPPVSKEAFEEAKLEIGNEFCGRTQYDPEFDWRPLSDPEAAAYALDTFEQSIRRISNKFEERDIRLQTAEAALKVMTAEEVKQLIYDTALSAEAGSKFLRTLCSQASEYWKQNSSPEYRLGP